MKRWTAWMLIVLLFISLVPMRAAAENTVNIQNEIYSKDPKNFTPNGVLEISIEKDGEWKKAGELEYDRFLRSGNLDLNPWISDNSSVKIRIVKNGGGAAHIDSLILGGSSPDFVNGEDGLPVDKLSADDFDVIPVDTDGIVVSFNSVSGNKILNVTARIEETVISKIPFRFPSANNYKDINVNSFFYSYKINSERYSLTIDGIPDEVKNKKPFFMEYCVPGSGHPQGYTYGWVSNDDSYLYISLDFTPDNTFDGNLDYAKGLY
ncbi:MAG TPA: hypothetical protein GXX14_07130 [Clostridiaceae bacterium]|nr:hypothetical protein [Clostridiaceae bacterium]